MLWNWINARHRCILFDIIEIFIQMTKGRRDRRGRSWLFPPGMAGVLTGAAPAAPRATTAWRPAPGRGGTTRVVRWVERGLAGHLVISHLLFVAEEAHHCQRKEIQQSQVCCGGGDGRSWSLSSTWSSSPPPPPPSPPPALQSAGPGRRREAKISVRRAGWSIEGPQSDQKQRDWGGGRQSSSLQQKELEPPRPAKAQQRPHTDQGEHQSGHEHCPAQHQARLLQGGQEEQGWGGGGGQTVHQTLPAEVVGPVAPAESFLPQLLTGAKTIRVQTDRRPERVETGTEPAWSCKNWWNLRVNIRAESCFINSYRKGELVPLLTVHNAYFDWKMICGASLGPSQSQCWLFTILRLFS